MEQRGERAAGVVVEELDVVALTQLLAVFVNAEIRRRLSAAGYGDLRESHGYLLQHLLGPDPVSITELARRLGVTQQAVSKSANELEAGGYLQRRPVPGDGRARVLALTPRGQAMIDSSRHVRADLVDELSGAVGDRALESARRTLARALQVLDPHGTVATRTVQPADSSQPPANRPSTLSGGKPRVTRTRRQ